MIETLTHPPKVAKLTDKVERISSITISQFPNEPKVSMGIKKIITSEFYDVIDEDFFHQNHIDFINNYICSQKNNQRRPSTFHIYQLTKNTYQSWFNAVVYESYTTINYGKTYTTLEFDEVRSNSVSSISMCESDCPCVFNYTQFPIFKTTFNLFTNIIRQSNTRYRLTNKTESPIINNIDYTEALSEISEYKNILVEMRNPTNWIFFNTDHYEMNVYYQIKHKNKTYYISYNLIGVYVMLKDFTDEKTRIKSKTAILDPILRILLTTHQQFYDEFNAFPIKVGLYYVDITEYQPQLVYKYLGKQSNLTYGYYKSQIVLDNPIITIPKIKIVPSTPYGLTNTQSKLNIRRFFKNTQYTTKLIEYDDDADDVNIGFFETTIIHTQPNKILRPTPTPTIKIDDFSKPIVLEPPIHIDPQRKPLNIVFKSCVKNTEIIRKMLNDSYNTSHSFREYANKYKTIKIVKDIHTDMNRLEKSRHFNCVFIETNGDESSVFHLYIADDKITAITTILNIL